MRAKYRQHAAIHAMGGGIFIMLAAVMFRMAEQSPAHQTTDLAAAWILTGIAFGNAVLCLINFARSRRH